jgi:hypothetical protein
MTTCLQRRPREFLHRDRHADLGCVRVHRDHRILQWWSTLPLFQ